LPPRAATNLSGSTRLTVSQRTFESISARAPYYMALNLLRIARNDYIGPDYGEKLVRGAKRLLRAG
jgi:hypothetical protein